MKDSLKQLYQRMADLTSPECANCRVPHSCCEPMYCQLAEEFADEDCSEYKTEHRILMFMGEDGCQLPPHLRPMCTMHTCEINSLGFKKGDPEWTKRYFELREEIELEEYEEIK